MLVEVLSPGTEEEDRGNKWMHYQRIAALQEYVLVSHVTPRVEVFRRMPDETWQYRDVTSGTLELRGAVIDLASLYTGLPA